MKKCVMCFVDLPIEDILAKEGDRVKAKIESGSPCTNTYLFRNVHARI